MAKNRVARLKAQKKYDEAHKGNYKTFLVKCNKDEESDIIDMIESQINKQGYIKALIRKDIKASKV